MVIHGEWGGGFVDDVEVNLLASFLCLQVIKL